jgi:hypothetical protein
MNVSGYPMFVILPDIANLSGTVYRIDGVATNNISSETSFVAIFFSELPGSIVFRSHVSTIMRYFVFAYPMDWICFEYYVSTSRNERWCGCASGCNVTIGHSQDICLFHVSDNMTAISGDYDTELGRDALYYEYSGFSSSSTARSDYYIGSGTFSTSANYFSAFRWHSNPSYLSTSFSVQLSSPSSTLPSRVCSGVGTSLDPIIMTSESESESESRSESESDRARTAIDGPDGSSQFVDGDNDGERGSAVPLVLSICLPTAALAIIGVVVFTFGMLFRRRLRDGHAMVDGRAEGHGIVDGRLDLSDEVSEAADEQPAMQRLMRDRERL